MKVSYQAPDKLKEVELEVVEFYEDGLVMARQDKTVAAEPGYIGVTHWIPLGLLPGQQWAAGRYYVYVYDGDRKVAEASYYVTQ